VLPRARLRNDSFLPHSARQEDLAKGVVDLVRAGMAEIFTLEVDFRATKFMGKPLGEIKGRWSSSVLMKITLELFTKARIPPHLRVGSF
jgi:hypothetical protein